MAAACSRKTARRRQPRTGGAHRPCFVLRRIAKNGSTALTAVAEKVVKRRALAIVKDNVPVPCALREHEHSVLGTIRNPRSFYTWLGAIQCCCSLRFRQCCWLGAARDTRQRLYHARRACGLRRRRAQTEQSRLRFLSSDCMSEKRCCDDTIDDAT